jgi:hypothetical protein
LDVEGQRIIGRLRQGNSLATIKCAFHAYRARVSPICDFHFLDARMDQANDAEIKGEMEEGAEERRIGMMEGDFATGHLVSSSSAFSGTEVPCAVICSVDQD